MRVNSNKESITEAILKTSRKLAAIIAVIAVIVFSFATCNGNNDEAEDDNPFNLPSAGNGFIGLTIDEKYPVEGAGSGTIEFTHYNYSDDSKLSDLFIDDYEVKIINGELLLKLGAPKAEKLVDAVEYIADRLGSTGVFEIEGASVTSGLKILEIMIFKKDDYRLAWYWSNETKTRGEDEGVVFIYANKPGKITYYNTGNEKEFEWFHKIDMDLKQGWNTAIASVLEDGDKKIIVQAYTTGKPQAKHQWELSTGGN